MAANRQVAASDELAELKQVASRLGGPESRRITELVGRLEEKQRREVQARAGFMKGYTELASKGQVIASVLPDLQQELQVLADAALDRARSDASNRRQATDQEVTGILNRVTDWLDLLGGFSGAGRARRRTIDVSREIDRFLELLQPSLDRRRVNVVRPRLADGDLFRAEIPPEAFRIVMHAVMTNALDWAPSRGERVVRLQIGGTEEQVAVTVSDSGPGFSRESAERAFDPMFSLKDGGHGMGLPLSRGVLETYRGSIEILLDGRRSGGNVRFLLPRKRSRATIHEG